MRWKRRGRPRKAYKNKHVTISLDEESYHIFHHQKNNHNMSQEYQRMLKARYGDSVDLKLKLGSFKEKLYEVQKERDEKREKMDWGYEIKINQILTIIKSVEAEIVKKGLQN